MDVFNPPALSRRARLEAMPACHRRPEDLAYMEAYDLLTAFPGELEAIYAGLTDAALEASRGASQPRQAEEGL